MKLLVAESQYTRFEIEDYNGNTLLEVDLADYEVADIEETDGHNVVRIQKTTEDKK